MMTVDCGCWSPLQSVVSGVTTAYNREQLWLANESLITKLQARCRGYLVRKGLRERMEYLKSNEPAATNIQVRQNAAMKTRGGRRCNSCCVCLRRLTGRATSRGGSSETGSSIWRTTAATWSRYCPAEFPSCALQERAWLTSGDLLPSAPFRSSPWSGCIRLARSTGIDSSILKTM